MDLSLKDIRIAAGLTQQQAAAITNIPLRTYKRYENDENKRNTIKYNYIVGLLQRESLVDEEHGVLAIDEIKQICSNVFSKYDVEYALLFGSYAKGKAGDRSDIDMVVSTSVTGLNFYGMVEELRTTLNKKVDLLTLTQLNNNPELLHEVLKDGIRVYIKSDIPKVKEGLGC